MTIRGMRATKAALLLFGLGLVLGFVAVVGEIDRLEWPASVIMAGSLVALPLALFADGHGLAALRWLAGRFGRTKPARPAPKPRAAGARRKAAKPAQRSGKRPARRKRG